MAKKEAKYSKEFKDRTVRLILEQGMKASQVAAELNVPATYVSQWKRDHLLRSKGITKSEPATLDEATKRIRALEKELLIAREERDILKKAVSFFARD